MRSKISFVCLLFLIGMLFTGCQALAVESAMKAPMETINNQDEINSIFKEKLGENFVVADLKKISPVHTLDFNNDGHEDIFVIYQNTNNPHIYYAGVLTYQEDNWVLHDGISASNKQLERVEFHDLNKDSMTEVYISWLVEGSQDSGLEVYTLDKEMKLVYDQLVRGWIVGDIIGDEQDQLFIVQQIPLEEYLLEGKVTMLTMEEDKFSNKATCEVEGYAYGPHNMIIGQAKEDEKGLFLDFTVGAHSGLTDLIMYKDDQLISVFYDEEKGTTEKTFKPYPCPSKDINNDGIIEIGTLQPVPGYENESMAGTIWYNEWYQWDGKDELKTVHYTYEDFWTGFGFDYPSDWSPKDITIKKDSNNDIYTFELGYVGEDEITPMFKVTAYNSKAWKEIQNKDELKVLDKNFKYVFVADIYDGNVPANVHYTFEELKEIIHLVDISIFNE